MRSQFTVAVLLGIVAASAADAADLANGGGYETYSPFVSRIDLPGEIKSLNVSNAAALGLYVASRRLRGS